MPWLIAGTRPRLIRRIVYPEPTGPPFRETFFTTAAARPYGLNDIPLTISPAARKPSVDHIRSTIAPEVAGNLSYIFQATSPAPRQFINLKYVAVVVVTTEKSHHAPYGWCPVKYLQQAGVQTQHLYLTDKGNPGSHGNGHLVFMGKHLVTRPRNY